MQKLAVLLLGVFLAASEADEECIDGGTFLKVTGKCYKFYEATVTLNAAEYICHQENLGHVASIANVFEMTAIRNLNPDKTSEYWIGANCLADQNIFVWDDGTPWSYTAWAPGNPKPTAGKCVAAVGANMQWYSRDCAAEKKFVCESTPYVSEWSYYPTTKHYYMLINNGKKYSFDEAEVICGKQGSHIASIHSALEAQFVKAIANREHVWIGMKNETWTDSTPVDYENWHDLGGSSCVYQDDDLAWNIDLCKNHDFGAVCKKN